MMFHVHVRVQVLNIVDDRIDWFAAGCEMMLGLRSLQGKTCCAFLFVRLFTTF